MKNAERTLREQIDRVHTTQMGAERIRRNLALNAADAAAWCREKILAPNAVVERRGKNWYITVDGCVLTVNAGSCTIITAHPAKK